METNKLRTWVEVSKRALLSNLKAYRTLLPNSIGIMSVVKSNAYGHGMSEVARILENNTDFFAVVFIEEALELRKQGIQKPILVLSTTTFDREKVRQAIRKNITFTIYDNESYKCIDSVAQTIRKRAQVHVNVDTGMSRLGFNKNEHEKSIVNVCTNGNFDITGLYSHLSSADSDTTFTKQQYKKFEKAVREAEKIHCDIQYKHILNTPGAMLGIKAGNIARIGRGIYGIPPTDTIKRAKKIQKTFSLQPALQWKTRIIQIQDVEKNTSIGYGQTYKTNKRTKLATLPIGFADGYNRLLSNKGEVLIRGTRAKVCGRVCMSNIIVDVSNVLGVKTNDEVTLIGKNKREIITAEEIATKTQTIPTEVVTTIHETIPRIYTA